MPVTATHLSTGRTATTGTSASLTLSASCAVGDFISFAVAIDNTGGSGAAPTTRTLGGTAATKVSWENPVTLLSDPGAASAGIYLYIRNGWVTSALTTSDTLSFTSGTAAIAVSALKISPSANHEIDLGQTSTYNNSTGSTFSSRQMNSNGNIPVGSICVGWMAVEAGNSTQNMTITGDSDTTNGSWASAVNVQGNANATSASNVNLICQWKIQTTAESAQTWDVSWATATDGLAAYLGIFLESDVVLGWGFPAMIS